MNLKLQQEWNEELTFTDPVRQAFYEKHGDFVVADDHEVLFEDGAVEEGCVGGQRQPPPKDAFERAKKIHRYFEFKADHALEQFKDFKAYLSGNGSCPAFIANKSDEKKLAYLKKLRLAAKKATAGLRDAIQEVEDETPAWIVARERERAEDERRKQNFRNKVDSIRL